jgi:hypothetical protein
LVLKLHVLGCLFRAKWYLIQKPAREMVRHKMQQSARAKLEAKREVSSFRDEFKCAGKGDANNGKTYSSSFQMRKANSPQH